MKKSLKLVLSLVLSLVIALSLPTLAYAAICPNDGTYMSVYSGTTYPGIPVAYHDHVVGYNGVKEITKPCTVKVDGWEYRLRCSKCGAGAVETGQSQPYHVY